MYINIQLLRFVAAFAVLGYHFGPVYNRLSGGYLGILYAPFLKYGFVGVDIFFVISGFVIWISTEKKNSYRDVIPFYVRRLARIYMSYWPWFLAMAYVVFYLRSGNPGDYKLIPNFFLVRAYSAPLLPISWTLTFEVMFYIVVGSTFLLSRRVALVAVLSWGVMALVNPTGSKSFFFNPLILEFVLGVLLAANRDKLAKINIFLVAALSLIFLYIGCKYAASNDYLSRALTFGIFSTFVVCFAIILEENGFVASNLWKALGDSSYAIYLSHYVLLTAMLSYRSVVTSHPDTSFLVLTVLTIVLSLIQSKYYDTPLMQIFKTTAHRTPKAAV